MTNLPWDADASVFRYPPLSDSDAGDPLLLFAGDLRGCVQQFARLDKMDRLNVEIETQDGETLYNAADIEQMIANVDRR